MYTIYTYETVEFLRLLKVQVNSTSFRYSIMFLHLIHDTKYKLLVEKEFVHHNHK